VSGEKKFRTGVSGYNKEDVNEYIERILSEFDTRLKEKDDEIAALKTQVRDLRNRLDQAGTDVSAATKDRERISAVLIQAQQKADTMLEEARVEAEAEKVRLERLLEGRREALIDIKRDIRDMKAHVSELLAKYATNLDEAEGLVEAREQTHTDTGEG
jgi:cell division septum initiation protein DivIVA